MKSTRRTVVAVVLALLAALVVALPAQPATAAVPLTNLAHLDWLGDQVAPPAQAGHTTYRIDSEPQIGVLWTYADLRSDGLYHRVGGGGLRDDGTWGQGAFNADDVSRAAVVYVRHWQLTGSEASKHKAYEMLRGLAYFQTVDGPNAGNVVLWMQPDGKLNPVADPPELPSPSDSGESYWLARTTWALGEAYAAFHGSADPADQAFAGFLADRLDLAVSALQRQTLTPTRYGSYLQIDGEPTPAWLVVDGADASAEAVLGLSAYVMAGGPSPAARDTLRKLAEGIAAMGGGDARSWPFGAVLPWALSLADWHAWASQMPAALARASAALGDTSLVGPVVRDSATFDPWLLTSGGPDNGRLPTRIDGSQIAYGVDSRLQSLLATADVTGSAGVRRLAAIVAAWYFGANASGQPGYDPTTGRPVDGVEANGNVNHNAGAESTIHALLSMLALDANPDVAAQAAQTASIVERDGNVDVQAEAGDAHDGAQVVTLTDGWTGESKYGGTGYVALPDGGSVTIPVGDGGPRLVHAVVNLQPGSTAVTTFSAGGTELGSVRSGAVGPKGDSPAPGALLPVTLAVTLPAGQSVVTATTVADNGDKARLDALMVEPLVSRLVLAGPDHGTALLRSAATTEQPATVTVVGKATAKVEVYDGQGRRVSLSLVMAPGAVQTRVLTGGFTIVRR
jgi:hypothetical protein